MRRTIGCSGAIPGGLEIQGLGKGPPSVAVRTSSLTGRRASDQCVCAGALFRKRFYALWTRGRVGWVVGIAVDALGGCMGAYTIDRLWHSWF